MDTIASHPSGFQIVSHRLLRLPEVLAMIGLSRATVYRLMDKGAFPRPVQLTERAVGWRATDVTTWISSRMLVNDGDRLTSVA